MKETEFHAWLNENVPDAEGALIGLGDDAAVLDTEGPLAVASDLLVEGVHFRKGEASPEKIGAKAVNRNFSDIAAMGLSPTWILVSAALPTGTDESFIKGLVKGMLEAASRYSVGLVGGDTSRSTGGVVIDVTVLAKVQGLKPVPRSGAKPGHHILVTGVLGGASQGGHIDFVPKVKEGLYLNRFFRPSAMIDLSDGLGLDLYRLLEASGVGATVNAERIPISKAARELASGSGNTPLQHALSDGEDFELLFTLPPEKVGALMEDSARFFEVTDLGEIKEDRSERFLKINNEIQPLGREGYDHEI